MKKIVPVLIALGSLTSFAYEIEGTLILKGGLKTEVRVNGVKTTCKVKVDDVKNLMEEDQYGNPAYKARVEVSLNGGDFLSSKRVKFDKEVMMTNLFSDGVRDLEYQGGGITLLIKEDSRLREARVPYQYSTVNCYF